MRVVIDTNVLISYLLSASNSTSKKTVNKVLAQNHSLLISNETFKELSITLLKDKFDPYVSLEKRQQFLLMIKSIAEFITIQERINKCRDKKDNQFLEVAVSGNANLIITGDKDLLVLNPFRNINILSPADFYQL
ncbi:MAG: putative toxin-antitoxin system toxin component, PIN family [Pseudomonadota bacterium]